LCFEAGTDDPLSKPIIKAELQKTVLKWAGIRNHETQASEENDLNAEFNQSGIFDLNKALEQVGGDRILLAEVLNIFFEDAAKKVDDLRDSLASGDVEKLKMTAHTLKGSSANVAAERIYALALEIERLIGQGRLGEIQGIVDNLPNEIDLVRTVYASNSVKS